MSRSEAARGRRLTPEERWVQAATEVVLSLASAPGEWSVDDVWLELEEEFSDVPCVVDPRRLGWVMRRAHSDGFIEPVGRWQRSGRRVNHGRPVMLWRGTRKAKGRSV